MSSSLLTNNAAMTALLSLNMTQQNLATYENQVSTGLKISSAADNASYWSIATSMNSQVGALGAVSSALSESGSMLCTMSAALHPTVSIMDNIQNDLITASSELGHRSRQDSDGYCDAAAACCSASAPRPRSTA